MKKLLFYFEFSLLGSIIWCILYENISVGRILEGFIVGFLCVLFANGFLMTRQTYKAYYINPLIFINFIFVLIFDIIKSGILIIPSLITGKTNVGIVKISTKIDGGLMTSTIANAITLTPGTVTIDKNENELIVLWLNVKSRNTEEAGDIIKGNFEKILMKGYKK